MTEAVAEVPSEAPANLDQTLRSLRSSLLETIFKGSALVAVIGAPASVLRSLQTGWLPLYTVHLVLAVGFIIVFLGRRHLPEPAKAIFVLAVFALVGISGLVSLGPLGAGSWWLVVCGLLVAILYSVRHGTWMIALALLVLAVVGTAFCQGWLTMPVDSAQYARNPMAWVNIAIGTILMPMVIFSAVAGLHDTTLALLHQVDEQRRQIERLASHDALTGLPSLTVAHDRLRHALVAMARQPHPLAVYFVDLDAFKAINDRHGHLVGDAVLRIIAQRLLKTLRAEDTVARLGGDEFLIVQSGPCEPATAAIMATRITRALAQPIDLDGLKLYPGGSVGVALATTGTETVQDMIRAADADMYQVKRQRKMAQDDPSSPFNGDVP